MRNGRFFIPPETLISGGMYATNINKIPLLFIFIFVFFCVAHILQP